MGIIIEEYTVTGNRGTDIVRVLYDTGASASFVRRDIAEPLGDFAASPISMEFMMADGQEKFTVDRTINLVVDVDNARLVHSFYVAEDLAEELVIGAEVQDHP
jgi:predicted aspartyl protease